MMKLAVIGTGYVGLVTGACFSELGLEVYCVDTNKEKIDQLLNGIMPIYENNLEELVVRNVKAGRLNFSSSLEAIVNQVEVIFITVNTPAGEDGSADLSYVLAAAADIGRCLKRYAVVVTKSTVPVGSTEKVREAIQAQLDKRQDEVTFDIAHNPEFLKEGNAIADFMKPDRVIIGVESSRAKAVLTSLYKPMLLNNFRVFFMDIRSAEMTKYACNAMLATRISFMNEIANLCESLQVDVNMVRVGMGADPRIGNKFLFPGCGYGGSCFPKDVKALIQTAAAVNKSLAVLSAVEEVNNRQKQLLFKKFAGHFNGQVQGKKTAVWGLAFKPETDDMREAPSIVLIQSLLKANCQVAVFDPVAMAEGKKHFGENVRYASDLYDATQDAEVLFHVTEWREFRMPNWEVVKQNMRPSPVLIDGRNVFDKHELAGFTYINI